MIIIGEKINGSIPIVAEAIAKRDSEFIKERAKLQAESGATYIDCCASVPEAEEVETLKWMIDCIQEVTDLPISIDSPSPDVLAQAYKFCKKPGIFNSVSGEGHKIDTIFPIMAEPGNEGWQVIALLSDNTGIPKCAADRLKVFDKIMAKAKEYGIAPDRIHIDPLVEMLCTSEDGIATNIETITSVREQYPTIHITAAISIFALIGRVGRGFISGCWDWQCMEAGPVELWIRQIRICLDWFMQQKHYLVWMIIVWNI